MNGLPGCGKTSLTENINITHSKKYHFQEDFYKELTSKTGRIKTLFYCFSKDVFIDVRFLLWILIHAETKEKKAAVKKAFKIFRFKGILKRIKNDYLLSEGYIQAFLELLDCMPDNIVDERDMIRRYFRHDIMNMNNVFFIYLYITPESTLSRIKLRNSQINTVDRMDENLRNRFIMKRHYNSVKINSYLFEILDKRRTIRIDASDSIEENSKRLNSFLDEFK